MAGEASASPAWYTGTRRGLAPCLTWRRHSINVFKIFIEWHVRRVAGEGHFWKRSRLAGLGERWRSQPPLRQDAGAFLRDFIPGFREPWAVVPT